MNNPIEHYLPIVCRDGFTGKVCTSTLQTSWAAATSFSPCSYLLNNLVLRLKNKKAIKVLQGFQYLAKPIDAVIQAIAMPIFTIIDHTRDLVKGNLLKISIKLLLTPISLPLKLFFSLFVSAGYLFNGGLQLVIPYSMIYCVAKEKEAPLKYFYILNEINNKLSHKIFIKPIQILPLKHNDDLNPYCKRRNQLFSDIDPEFRDFNNVDLDLITPNMNTHTEIRFECSKIINKFKIYCKKNPNDRNSTHFKNLQAAINKAKADIQESLAYFKKRNLALSNFKLIDEISKYDSCLLINNGYPILAEVLMHASQIATEDYGVRSPRFSKIPSVTGIN